MSRPRVGGRVHPIRRLTIAVFLGIAIFAVGAGAFLLTADPMLLVFGFRIGAIGCVVFAFFPTIKRLATE